MNIYQKQKVTEKAKSKQENVQRKGDVEFKDNRTTQLHSINAATNNYHGAARVAQLQELADNKSASTQLKSNNTGLPNQLKANIETMSGYTMDDVKVHYNSSKPAQLQAHAYAQGTDIHIASGQEKHLAHEAWHVVQQKQGRVQPTKQMKGKVNINDDDELEREADVMGAKALQMKGENKSTILKKGNIQNTSAQAVQRYAAKTDANSNKVYNVSTNDLYVVGVGFPNHELYIRNTAGLAAMNERLKHGLLKFVDKGVTNFNFSGGNVAYHKILPEHKTDGVNAIDADTLKTGIKKELVRNLVSKDADFSEAGFQQNYDQITTQFTTNTTEAKKVYAFSIKAEGIRKSMIQLDYKHGEGVELIRTLKGSYVNAFAKVNEYLNGTEEDKEAVKTEIDAFRTQIPGDPDQVLLKMVKVEADELYDMVDELPDRSNKKMVKKGHLQSQIASMGNDELLLPRGCDLVAATTLGKKNENGATDNFAMTFNSMDKTNVDPEEHHHYSTKLFGDGTDFVSIEGFAKGGYNVFDNTWEFFLHGHEPTEVEAFHAYTKNRYEFFPSSKITLEKEASGLHGDKIKIETVKNFEDRNAMNAFDFYNSTLASGGNRGALKTKGARDAEEQLRQQQERNNFMVRVMDKLNFFSTKATQIAEDPHFAAALSQGRQNIFNELNNGIPAMTVAYSIAMQSLCIGRKNYHIHMAKTLAEKLNIRAAHHQNNVTFMDNLIAASDTEYARLGATSIKKKYQINTLKTKLNAIKDMIVSYNSYEELHLTNP